MFVSLDFSCSESPTEFLADLPDFEKKIVPLRRLHWIHRLYLYSSSLNISSLFRSFLFIMNQQSETYRQNIYVGVGVMKDYKLKLRNLRVSHTLS